MIEAKNNERILVLIQDSMLDLRRNIGMLGYVINEMTIWSLLLENMTYLRSNGKSLVEEWPAFLSDIYLMMIGEIELMEEHSNRTGYWLIEGKV